MNLTELLAEMGEYFDPIEVLIEIDNLLMSELSDLEEEDD